MTGSPAPQLQRAVDSLLAASSAGDSISIDVIGAALGDLGVGTPEIEWVFQALETAGRTIASDEGGRGEANLGKVLASARVIRQREGRVPTQPEIALEANLTEREVAYALALTKVMQR